jgi:hypothetical protein
LRASFFKESAAQTGDPASSTAIASIQDFRMIVPSTR